MQSNDQRQQFTHVQSIHSPLIQGQSLENIKKTTQLFSQLLREFKLYYLVAIMINLLMCALFTVQYFRKCNDPSLNMWMLFASIIFLIQFIFYILVVVPSYNEQKCFNFAEQLNEVIFDGDEDPYYQLLRKARIKKRKRIENLIRSHFKNYLSVYWYIDMSLTICDLALVIVGVVLFCLNDYFQFMFSVNKKESFSQDCEFSSGWITFWSIVLLCISRKNAFQLLLLILISIPVLICYIPVKLMKQNKQKQKYNKECFKILKSIKYHPNTISGDDHQCSICRIDYAMGDNVKILPCSPLHHFHSNCVKAWFRISSTCPLCRKEIGKIIDDIKSNQGFPSYLVLDNPFLASSLAQDGGNQNINIHTQINIDGLTQSISVSTNNQNQQISQSNE